MANKKVYLDFFIHLTDEKLVATLQGTRFRTGGVFSSFGEAGHPIMAPDDAAVEWGAPIVLNPRAPWTLETFVDAPKITSEYFYTEHNYPHNVKSFEQDGGGWFGIGFLFGSPDTTFFWRGTFIYAGPAVGESPVPGTVLVPMPQRRWIDGMELPWRGEEFPPAFDNAGLRTCRAASRSMQGLGLHIDAPSGSSGRQHTSIGAGRPSTQTQWERFYFRPRRFGATEYLIWSCASQAVHGVELYLLPSGQLAVKNVSNVAVRVTLAVTAAVPVHVWQKVDVIYQFSLGAPPASFKLFLNGVLTVDLNDLPLDNIGLLNVGLRVNSNINFSQLGSTAADPLVSIDFDDWIGADPPDPSLLSKDFYAGSRVAFLSATGYAADHNPLWVGDWRLLRQRMNYAGDATTFITSSTAGARLSVLTDADLEVDRAPNARGAAALVVQKMGRRAGVANGTLGYTLPGGAAVMAAVVEAAGNQVENIAYFPAGLLDPFPLGGLELKYDKAASVDLAAMHNLQAVAEVIGIFGPEDQVPIAPVPGGGSATGPAAGSLETVTTVKNGLVARAAPLAGPCGAFEIVKRVAWALKNSGCGLLSKPTGNNCQGYATDLVCFKDGAGNTLLYDVLIDGGGANTPAWNAKTPLVGIDRWRAPIDPGDAPGSSGDGVTDIATWAVGEAYSVGARVSWTTTPFGLREYVALLAHTGQMPAVPLTGVVNATYWQDMGLTLGDGVAPPIVRARHLGQHNAPYPRTAYASGGSAPLSPVVTKTGTYVGTGTYVELTFPAPVHFLWIRAVTGGNGPIVWFSPMNAGHSAISGAIITPIVEPLMDPAFAGATAPGEAEEQCVVRIAGAQLDRNAVGVVYSYLAICDPGMRFLLGDTTWVNTGTVAYVNPLPHEDFTPEALFMNPESWASGRLSYKGIGHTANAITRSMGVAEVTDGVGFSLGALTLRPGLFVALDSQVPYMAFRRDDGGTADATSKARVIQLATYTGDGNASRTIGLTPASGRRPMWTLIVPHNAVQPIYRDPAHTGTTSTQLPAAANAATGITGGGIDAITVGLVLNATGIVYDVFVVPGCDGAAGNGGWSTACQVIPVPVEVPRGPGWPPEPADPETPDVPWPTEPGGGGGGGGGGPTDFGAQCVDASTTIINQALSRIGVSKRVGDIVSEASEEAEVARLHYSDDVAATLRDFPWPFATRYVSLVRVAGTQTVPVNGDWQYAYRLPTDLLFARRLVPRGGAGRRWDPTPIEFRLGSDDAGGLLYTHHAEVSLVDPLLRTVDLEYTLRVACAAGQGDALFRQALIWRHAASLAPVLSKDAKKATFCLQMYALTLGTAATAAANEQEHPPAGPADWIAGRE